MGRTKGSNLQHGWPTAGGSGTAAAQVVLLLVPTLLLAVLAWQSRAVIDDAYINFRIIENLLDGHGPVYNVGERVEAGTSPAWLAILAGLSWLSGDARAWLPWLSVVAGVAFGVLGLTFAQAAALALWKSVRQVEPGWPALLVPAGSLVVVAVPPFREFIACGLETGLVIAWVGLSAWGLATRRPDGGQGWRAVAIGVGPLVRPEMATIGVPLLVALLFGVPMRLRARMTLLGCAAAMPVAVQVLRMGYFAALVPNTALAKEAFDSFWARGAAYLVDFVAPYWLVVPLLPLGVMAGRLLLGPMPAPQRIAVLALLSGGFLNALYVVRLGGDFMHARMWLPAVFAVLAPVSLWPALPRRRSAAFAFAAQACTLVLLAVWAAWCATSLRVPYAGQTADSGIADEVNFYRRLSGQRHPVDPADYRAFGAYAVGLDLRALADRGERWLILDDQRWPLAPGPAATIVTDGVMIGLAGYVAGPAVHIADSVGLTDPIASRLRLSERGRTGHEKSRPRDWMVGRFATAEGAGASGDRYPGAAAARAAIACDGLRRLLGSVTEPLTVQRFIENMALSVPLTRLRIPADPSKAEAEVCGAG